LALATLLTSPCWLRPLAALARRAGVLSRPQGCAPVRRGGGGVGGGGGGGGGVGGGVVGCVVGGGRDVVLVLELALDEWCSCKKLKQSNHDMQYCAQYLSNKLQFKHPGESVIIQ
jgi:hypothetical protein